MSSYQEAPPATHGQLPSLLSIAAHALSNIVPVHIGMVLETVEYTHEALLCATWGPIACTKVPPPAPVLDPPKPIAILKGPMCLNTHKWHKA